MKRKYSLLVIALLVLSLTVAFAFTVSADGSGTDMANEAGATSPLSGIKASLVLYSDFTINFYIPTDGCVIDKVTANGKVFVLDSNAETFTNNNVEYYKIQIPGISTDRAGDDIAILFEGEGYSETKTFSVIRYCDLLLSKSECEDVFALAASIVKYVESAYDYSGREKSELLTRLLVSEKYTSNLQEQVPPSESKTDEDTASLAISGAQLNLNS